MTESTIPAVEQSLVLKLFGAKDQNVRRLREALQVAITHHDGAIHISGENGGAVSQATSALEQLKSLAERQDALSLAEVNQALARVTGVSDLPVQEPIDVMSPAKRISPRTPGQAVYVRAIRESALTFAIGPAGTGKTYLATALAVEALKHHHIRKIVLCRPAVEAGESLGYLPGDMQAKIHPYLRPLLDALQEMADADQIKRLMEQDAIEVVPLAYMRGRTLNDAFIILDEAQNATTTQMKMFLTRMGMGSKVVVSGDTTQIDLPKNTTSGLHDAILRLRDIDGISIVELTGRDIVRHRLVQDIVNAYDDSPSNLGVTRLKR
jgi:phosphate starvation-inducible protein PhoH and related proteins